MENNPIYSVSAFIQHMLPMGSRGILGNWNDFPYWPPDLFAVTASLVQRTDGYTYLVSKNDVSLKFRSEQTNSGAINTGRKHYLDMEAAKALKYNKAHPDSQDSAEGLKRLKYWWKTLISCSADILDKDSHKDWLPQALLMMIAADEASEGIGYNALSESSDEKQDVKDWLPIVYRLLQGNFGRSIKDQFYNQKDRDWWVEPVIDALFKIEELKELRDEDIFENNTTNFSACILVPTQHACVQPKARTPRIGCTLRSMTHNLALLPSSGEVKVRWIEKLTGIMGEKTFNILLYPFPTSISGNDFSKSDKDFGVRDNGYFMLKQTWLNHRSTDASDGYSASIARVSEKIFSLVDAAKQHVHRVDMVLLPELALNEDVYRGVFDEFIKKYHTEGITLADNGGNSISGRRNPYIFVSGVSHQDKKDANVHYNSAVTSIIYGARDTNYSSPENHGPAHRSNYDCLHIVQHKHHRWLLDDSQVRAYSLGDPLNPTTKWWEHIAIDQREVNNIAFRHGSCFTTLVCEDLARIDPCQNIIRAIGPNLVIALLMDGPQLRSRWPGRYAMGLSDDPGCSVLSVTSLGLIERSNRYYKKNERSVALWRDCGGKTEELSIPDGSEALLLTLTVKIEEEFTLDQRSDGDTANTWVLSGSIDLKTKDRREKTNRNTAMA